MEGKDTACDLLRSFGVSVRDQCGRECAQVRRQHWIVRCGPLSPSDGLLVIAADIVTLRKHVLGEKPERVERRQLHGPGSMPNGARSVADPSGGRAAERPRHVTARAGCNRTVKILQRGTVVTLSER